MLILTNIPLSVYNRALELYGEPPEADTATASAALLSAEGRKDYVPEWPGIGALGQAIAEHMASGEGYETRA